MSTRTLVIAIAGSACVSAAAAGGFVAAGMNRADRALAEAGAPNAPAPPAPTAALVATPAPTVADPPVTPATTVTPVPTAAKPVRRTDPPAPAARAPMTPPRTVAVTPVPVTPVAPQTADPPTAAPPTGASATPPDPPAPPVEAPATDPKPVFDEISVKADSVIGVSLETPVSSATAKVEDRVTGRVTRDVTVDGRVAIPSNSRLEGVVTVVQHGGKFKEQARIGVRFTTLYLPDNTKIAIQTEPIFREGEAPANGATSKVGTGTVLGAILGAVIGGKKGAAIGAAAGAGGGAAAVAAGHVDDATIASGVPMTVRLTAPVTVTIPRDQDQ